MLKNSQVGIFEVPQDCLSNILVSLDCKETNILLIAWCFSLHLLYCLIPGYYDHKHISKLRRF